MGLRAPSWALSELSKFSPVLPGLCLPSGAIPGAPGSLQAGWVRAVSPRGCFTVPCLAQPLLGADIVPWVIVGAVGSLPTGLLSSGSPHSQHCRAHWGGGTHLELPGSCHTQGFALKVLRAHQGVHTHETVPRSWGWSKATSSRAQGSLPAFAMLLRKGLKVWERTEPARVLSWGLPGLPAARTELCGEGAAELPAPLPRVAAGRGCEPRSALGPGLAPPQGQVSAAAAIIPSVGCICQGYCTVERTWRNQPGNEAYYCFFLIPRSKRL